MATGEDQAQAVILDSALALVVFLVFAHRRADLPPLALAHARPAQAIERQVARGHLQPATGAFRDAVAGPAFQGSRERILGALLREIPIAGNPDQMRDY